MKISESRSFIAAVDKYVTEKRIKSNGESALFTAVGRMMNCF